MRNEIRDLSKQVCSRGKPAAVAAALKFLDAMGGTEEHAAVVKCFAAEGPEKAAYKLAGKEAIKGRAGGRKDPSDLVDAYLQTQDLATYSPAYKTFRYALLLACDQRPGYLAEMAHVYVRSLAQSGVRSESAVARVQGMLA